MKVIISGATGLIGNLLVLKLIEKGYQVSIITRNKSKIKNKWKSEVDIIEGDITKEGSWMEVINGIDIIINLSGENVFKKRWWRGQKQKINDSRELGTKNIVKAISNASIKPKLLISPSGIDYYDYENHIHKEEDQVANTFLGKVCQNWEKEIPEVEKLGVRYVIFRYGLVLSHSGKGGEKMFISHKFFMGSWPSPGSQIFTWIHQDDFINLILWAIENNHVKGIYNAVASEQLNIKEFSKIGGKILHRPTWFSIPKFILKIILGERSELLIKGRKVSNEKLITAGYRFKFNDVNSALTDILIVR